MTQVLKLNSDFQQLRARAYILAFFFFFSLIETKLTALEDTIDLNGLKLKKSCDIKKKSDIL